MKRIAPMKRTDMEIVAVWFLMAFAAIMFVQLNTKEKEVVQPGAIDALVLRCRRVEGDILERYTKSDIIVCENDITADFVGERFVPAEWFIAVRDELARQQQWQRQRYLGKETYP